MTFMTYANEWLYPYSASTRPVGVRRSTSEAHKYRAAAAAASEMFSGFGAPAPLVAGLYSRHVAGKNCIGPTARSNERSPSSTPLSVSWTTGNPPCPLSTGPRIAGFAMPAQFGLPEPPLRPWFDSTSPDSGEDFPTKAAGRGVMGLDSRGPLVRDAGESRNDRHPQGDRIGNCSVDVRAARPTQATVA